MNSGELVVSPETLSLISILTLYILVGLFSFWQLLPRLSAASKLLARGMLAAQVLVILLALTLRTSSAFANWLWNLDPEWNIPSTLASTQLAVVGGVALITAWLAKARPSWHRLYLVAIGLIFLFLALDEYFAIYRVFLTWQVSYAKLGAAVVVTTTIVALRSPRRAWKWHLSLLTGLSLIALGAIVFDNLYSLCGSLKFFRIDGCLDLHDLEESLELLGCWLALLAVLGQYSEVAPTPQSRVRSTLYALPALWMLLLSLYPLTFRLELLRLAEPASVEFESGVHLQGYSIDNREGESVIRIYASAALRDYVDAGYFVNLVDQVSGESIVSRYMFARYPVGVLFAPGLSHVFRLRMEVNIPPQTPVNRALWITLTLWYKQDDTFVSQKVIASDHTLLKETQVILGELVLPAESAASPTASLAAFDNGYALEAVELSQRAHPGESLNIRFAWRSDVAGNEDLAQFLYLLHEEDDTWWGYDQQPLGPRLPTRLWYEGLADSETWQVPLPADLAPGRYNVFTGLYRTRDLERIPVRDGDGGHFVDARVPLGALIVER